jgi:hypothetical protein
MDSIGSTGREVEAGKAGDTVWGRRVYGHHNGSLLGDPSISARRSPYNISQDRLPSSQSEGGLLRWSLPAATVCGQRQVTG